MEKETSKRIKKILLRMKAEKTDAFLISSKTNIRYLTGIEEIEGYLAISSNYTVVFTDFRYISEAKKQCRLSGVNFVRYKKNPLKTIAEKLKREKLKRIWFEAKGLPYQSYLRLKESFTGKEIKLIPSYNIVEEIRAIKDPSETENIKKAVSITCECFKFVKSLIYPGINEKFIALEIERFLKLKGDLTIAFPPITAAGSLSAQPHHHPQKSSIYSGKILLVDMGAKHKGYCADLTRVIFSSRMPLYLKKVNRIIEKARELAIKKAKPGIKISEIDKAARGYIEKKGFGKYFGHALGHGVGLDVHELPSVNSSNQGRLKQGMVLTIEPGIYLPGKFGIRKESVILIKNKPVILDEYC